MIPSLLLRRISRRRRRRRRRKEEEEEEEEEKFEYFERLKMQKVILRCKIYLEFSLPP
jgi:hypothetical protein